MYKVEWYYEFINMWCGDDCFLFLKSACKFAVKHLLSCRKQNIKHKECWGDRFSKWRVKDCKTNTVVFECSSFN